MKREPKPRQKVYDTYWYFAVERLRMMLRRAAGEPGPWTEDPILQTYKFCNTFRAADRVSQYMIKEVCYAESADPVDKLFQIVAFRTFSRPETWERLKLELGGPPVVEHLQDGSFVQALDAMRQAGHGLYTAAFILCANAAYGHSIKHRNHAALFHDMFVESQAGEAILNASSFEELYEILHSFPLMGDFMSYQTAIDINYSDLANFSENDFTKPGPGALRGLQKTFVSLGDFTPEETIMWMVDRQEQEFERLGLEFGGLFGRRLHAIDCQGLFCETDKYSREAFPHLVSARSRIKARFTPKSDPRGFFFPPKWGLTGRVPEAPRSWASSEGERSIALGPID